MTTSGAQRWNSFLPWPMSLHAECLSLAGRWDDAARTRNDRVTDRYVWISCFTALTRIQLEVRTESAAAARLAARLYDDAARVGLPGSAAWALSYRGAGDDATLGGLAREIAADVEEPALHERIGEVFGAEQPDPGGSRPR